MKKYIVILAAVFLLGCELKAEEVRHPEKETKKITTNDNRLPPYGATLFNKNFPKEQTEGIQPEYVITHGDRISIQTWGALELSNVFMVDGQGNIFIPEIGPVSVKGVRNRDLNQSIQNHIKKVYKNNVQVYTNLLTAKPVSVYVGGNVNSPGRYTGLSVDSILYFLNRADGINSKLGSYRTIHIKRQNQTIASVDLYEFLLKGIVHPIQLEDNDVIFVEKRGPVISLKGDVAQEVDLEFKTPSFSGQNVLDIIPESSQAGSISLTGMRAGSLMTKTFGLSEFRDQSLKDGDIITVHQESRSNTLLVYLKGENLGPQVISVQNGTSLIDLLNLIPVDPGVANIQGIHIHRKSVANRQREAIRQSLFHLERRSMLALSGTSDEAQIRAKEAQLVQDFVKNVKQLDPLGVVVTNLNGHQQNILLEPDDQIIIPRRSNVVQVDGEVYIPNAIVYQPSYKISDYIAAAGGYAERADVNNAIIIHPDGSVVSGMDMIIEPGDRILIPPLIDTKSMQFAIDITSMLYKIAVATGVLLRLR